MRWSSHARGSCVFVASIVLCLIRADAGADDTAEESLRSLADAYADVRVVAVDMSSGTLPHAQLMRIVSHRNGDVAARYWPSGTAWKDIGPRGPKPDYFVFSNGTTLYSMPSHAPGYTSFDYSPDVSKPWTLNVHHFLAPWPYISRWACLLLDARDVVYASDADVLSASSESIGLSLSWNRRLEIVRIVRKRTDGSVSTMTFDSFDTRVKPRIPRSIHHRIAASEAEGVFFREVVSECVNVRLNDAADEPLLAFDPVALGVYRYEQSTGNVYNHDGTLLYNEKAFLKQAGMPVAGTDIAALWYIAIIIAGALSGWAAHRQIASGPLHGPSKSWLAYASAIARVLVGLFFLLAVVAKLSTVTYVGGLAARGAPALAAVIRQHGVIPSTLAPSAAYTAIGLELAIAVSLLAHRRVRVVSIAAIGLLGVMSAYLVVVWIMRGNVSCGCLGKLTNDQLSTSLVRNTLAASLLVPSILRRSR